MKFSIIIPVYNRPDEVDELLQSLCEQTVKDFEVIIVEDGSINPCKDVCSKYAGILSLHYYAKENSGPGQSRNYGAERANGKYVHPDFTPVQKAISYSMTSFFTTGGIRGGKAKLDKFYPRSYNMGVRHDVYLELGGFSKMRFGEDIDFSYRIVEAGYKPRLFPEAWVWHKRRTDFKKFFRQVYNSGIARINLEKRHPGTMKLVHLLPTAFTVGVIALILISAVGRALMHYVDHDQFYWMCFAPWIPILFYSFLICIDSSIKNKSLKVGILSIPAAFVQLMGYGLGFIESWWKRCVRGQNEILPCEQTESERQAFENNFYK